MRRSPRIAVAWLLLLAMSFNPLLGALAIGPDTALSAPECQIVADKNAADEAGQGDQATHAPDCTQHHTCNSVCQLAPLQPTGPAQILIVRRPWLVLAVEPEDLATRFLESIERPPRV
jgi:hypothetical protein